MQTLFTADLCTFVTLFGTCRCKFTNYRRNMQIKSEKIKKEQNGTIPFCRIVSANWLLKCACQWEDNPLEVATAARPNETLAQARMPTS